MSDDAAKRLREFAVNHASNDVAWDISDVLDEMERLRAERELLGAGEVQQRIVTPGGLIYPPSERDLAMRDHWLPGVRLEQRTVYGTPWVDAGPEMPQRTVSGD